MMLFAHGNPIAQTAGAKNSAGIVSWVRAQAQERKAPRTASASG